MEAANRFIRAETYRRVGGYHPELVGEEDFELHDRLVAAGARVGRSRAMITHHEGTAFWGVVRKKFYYGTHARRVLREAPGNNFMRFVFLKPAYFRNWRRLARHPLLALGLVTMKTVQFLAGGAGFALSLARRTTGG